MTDTEYKEVYDEAYVKELLQKLAADYTADTIKATVENPEKPWYGVDFEATIPEPVTWLGKLV